MSEELRMVLSGLQLTTRGLARGLHEADTGAGKRREAEAEAEY